MQTPSRRSRQRVLAQAYEEGIGHFDVARMYGLGAAEGELGQFARGKRDSMVIATKFGIEAGSAPRYLARIQSPVRRLMARYPSLRKYVKRHAGALHQPRRYDAQTARSSLETSLRELRTDYVDVFFVHDPTPADRLDLPEISAYLETARQAGHIRAWGIAGEREPCVSIKHALPDETILQVRDDVFSRTPAPDRKAGPMITFGVIAGALERMVTHLSGSPERCRRWSEEIGADCSSPQVIASLLFRDALSANSEGVVLYSTTRSARLHGVGSLVTSAASDDASLARFQDRVAELIRDRDLRA
jgi:hypothetical protein